MNILEIFEKLISVLDKAIVGVIVGSLLAPITATWIERRKRKTDVRIKLVQILYEYVNQLKDVVKFQGFHHYYQARANACNEFLKTVSDDLEFADNSKIMEMDYTKGEKYDDKSHVTNEIVIKIESEIQGLLLEIGEYYGKKKYRKIKLLIDPEIEKSNNGYYFISFREFTNWSHQKFVNDDLSLGRQITQTGIDLQKEYNILRDKITDVLL